MHKYKITALAGDEDKIILDYTAYDEKGVVLFSRKISVAGEDSTDAEAEDRLKRIIKSQIERHYRREGAVLGAVAATMVNVPQSLSDTESVTVTRINDSSPAVVAFWVTFSEEKNILYSDVRNIENDDTDETVVRADILEKMRGWLAEWRSKKASKLKAATNKLLNQDVPVDIVKPTAISAEE